MKLFFLSSLLIFLPCIFSAQTVGGNAFRIDYDDFLETQNVKFFNCGNNDILNVGNELTVMSWIQLRSTLDDQKLIGKYGLNESGFSFGVIQGSVYPAIWNPTPYLFQDGVIDNFSQFWYHLAITYSAGDAIRSFVNGVEVDDHNVTNNPIVPNTDDLIIGIASWDLSSFQAFGNMDEMAVYNVALSEDEIKSQMFRPMTGLENGMVAGYNFNVSSGSTLPDVTGNGNTGVGNDNFDGTEWVISHAPLADNAMSSVVDLNGIWNGLSLTDPRFTTTDNGMNLLAFELDTNDYAVFGHNEGEGVTIDNIPDDAPINFERSQRIWSLTANDSPICRVIINLEAAAGMGQALPLEEPEGNYTLMWRPIGGNEFISIANGDAYLNGTVAFDDVTLTSGEYTIGIGDEPFLPTGIWEPSDKDVLSIYPNPSNGLFEIQMNAQHKSSATLDIYNVHNKVILSQKLSGNGKNYRESIDISFVSKGVYFLKITSGSIHYVERLIVH